MKLDRTTAKREICVDKNKQQNKQNYNDNHYRNLIDRQYRRLITLDKNKQQKQTKIIIIITET